MNNLSSTLSSTGALAGGYLGTLVPELFPLISSHLPHTDRSASLLTLAMACRRLHDIIITHLLYRAIRLESVVVAFDFLVKLKEEAMLDNEQVAPSTYTRSQH